MNDNDLDIEQEQATRSHYRDKEGKHRSVRWGSLKTVQVPQAIFQYDQEARSLIPDKNLNACAVSVYTALLASHADLPTRLRSTEDNETVLYSTNQDLQRLTGYNRFEITRAIRRLLTAGYISRNTSDWDGGTRLTKDSYIQLDPRPKSKGEVVQAGERHRIRYYTYPLCVLTESQMRWSQAKMSNSQFILYQTAMFLANQYRSNCFRPKIGEMRRTSGLSLNTYKRCFEELQSLGLLYVEDDNDRQLIHVCDPYTGEPLMEMDGIDQHNPANYYTTEKGRERRLNLNIDLSDPEAVKSFLFNTLGYDKSYVLHEDNIDICCPWHGDTKPSLSVALAKKGCWTCHKPTCGRKGWLLDLCAGFGNVTFRPPDSQALAIYTYRDEFGHLLYQVLRYPNRPNGEKHFSTRQGGVGDYRWDRKDMPRTLFNRDLLQYQNTVVICEGEKDATTITTLWPDKVVGTTSGGANSWDNRFIKFLEGKRCIVMIDADEDGQKYQADIVASLDAANIEYRVVSIGDLGCKDVTEYVEKHFNDPTYPEELVRHMGIDWIDMPDGRALDKPYGPYPYHESFEDQDVEV